MTEAPDGSVPAVPPDVRPDLPAGSAAPPPVGPAEQSEPPGQPGGPGGSVPPGWSSWQPPPWAAPGGYAGSGWGAAPSGPAAPPPPGPHGAGGPATPTSGYGVPGAGTPGAGTPGAGAPGYGAPGYGAPGYGAPGYGAPGYGAPGYGAPGYGVPVAWQPPPTAPKPGVVPLRPLGLGELLDGAVTYIRRNPRATLGLATVLSVISAIVQFLVLLAALQSIQSAATGATGSSMEDLTADALLGTTLASNAASLVSVVVSVIVQIVATGVFTVIVGAAVLGQRLTAGEAWRRARPALWRLLGLTLLSTAAVTAIVVAGIGVAVLLGLALGTAGVLLGLGIGLAAVVASVWLYVQLLLAPAALVLERCGVIAAWRRSFALTTGSWWRIFGIFLLTQIISSLVASVLVVPLTVLGTIGSVAVGDADAIPWPLLLATAIGQLLGGIVTLPFVSGVTALLYVDRRMRREAFDLRLTEAAPALGSPVPAADPLGVYVAVQVPHQQPPPPPRPAAQQPPPPPPPAW